MNFDEDLILPITFTFPKVLRYSTLTIGFGALILAICWIVFRINADASTIQKILPFIAMFLTYDSIQRNLFTLNKVIMTDEHIEFAFIAKKSVIIKWDAIKKLDSTVTVKRKHFTLHYTVDDTTKKFDFSMAFKNIIDIINYIKRIAPHIETDEFVQSLMYIPNKSVVAGKDPSPQKGE